MTLLPDPFPAKDRIVDKQGYPTEVFVKYFEGQEDLIGSAASNIGSVSSSSGSGNVATTEVQTSKMGTGIYRVSFYLEVITPAGVSSSLDVTISWTSNGVAKSNTSTAMTGNLVTSFSSGVLTIHSDGDSPITYALAYASNPASAMIYAAYVTVERIG